jgi:hypothetical protein
MQMVQLSATRRSCIAIMWVSLVSFAAITICVAFQRVFVVVVVYFIIDLVRKLLNIPSCVYIIFFSNYPPIFLVFFHGVTFQDVQWTKLWTYFVFPSDLHAQPIPNSVIWIPRNRRSWHVATLKFLANAVAESDLYPYCSSVLSVT